jgi:hypothetical protein
MKVNRVVLQLLFTVLVLLPSYCFSQNLKKDKKHNPEKILEFLDKNNDKLISKQEAKKAKKLNQNFAYLDSNNDGFLSLEELSGPNTSNRYTYLENDGIHLYFETEDKELYRKLLPTEFEIPTRLLAYTFTCDFYKMDSNSQPYKETSIFILGKYKNQEIWHCIYMPVTSKESMLVGKHRLGLPKTMGEIELVRSENEYQANSTDENNGKVALSIIRVSMHLVMMR